MQKLREKINKKQLLWIGIGMAAVLLLVLLAVFLIMDSAEPPVPAAQETEPEETVPVSAYKPEDFVLNENGFMTCLSADYATGIDVSSYQGEIDWQKVKAAGVEFVFIRVGSRGSTEGKLYSDDMAQNYYEGAKAAGLQVGAYFYSQAVTPGEAEEEAWFVLKQVAQWALDLPVVYDWEWGGEDSRTTDMEKSLLTQCTVSFCEIIEGAGLQPMIYFNKSQGLEQLDLEQLQDYPFWLAMYDSAMDFPYRVDYWQYTQAGTVDGIEGDVDLNIYLPS